LRLKVTEAPRLSSNSTIDLTSAILGTLRKTMGSEVNSAAAMIGSAAFLEPLIEILPTSEAEFPWIIALMSSIPAENI
jgi:hypothetical protein